MKRTLCVAVTEEVKRKVTLFTIREKSEKNKIMESFVEAFLEEYDDNNCNTEYFKKNGGNYNERLILRLENEKRYKLKEICDEKDILFQDLINNIVLINLNERR